MKFFSKGHDDSWGEKLKTNRIIMAKTELKIDGHGIIRAQI